MHPIREHGMRRSTRTRWETTCLKKKTKNKQSTTNSNVKGIMEKNRVSVKRRPSGRSGQECRRQLHHTHTHRVKLFYGETIEERRKRGQLGTFTCDTFPAGAGRLVSYQQHTTAREVVCKSGVRQILFGPAGPAWDRPTSPRLWPDGKEHPSLAQNTNDVVRNAKPKQ